MRLRHGVPSWQKSVQLNLTCRMVRACRKAGMHQRRLECGFSITAGIFQLRHSWKIAIENRASSLPSRTLRLSFSDSSASPFGHSFDHKGGGPPGRSRALLKELQGVPIHTSAIMPARIQPCTFCWTCFESRSFSRCHLMSSANTAWLTPTRFAAVR